MITSKPSFEKLDDPTAKIYIKDCSTMDDLEDESVHLVVTSPPYWQIKDYGNESQIGWNQTLPEYLTSLSKVWKECFRVLKPGCRLCINIGDQYSRKTKSRPYQIIPLHAFILNDIMDMKVNDRGEKPTYFGSIVWQKVSTTKTSGGGVFMGSYPHPRNGMVTYNNEFIAIFRKPGKPPKVSKELKEMETFTKDEWKQYFLGTWDFPGVKQQHHIAMFPEELPYRLIRMFSFPGETVLDPFAGSGTTLKVANELGRNAVGYEIGWGSPNWRGVISNKVPNVEFID